MQLQGTVSALSKSDETITFTLRSSDGRVTPVQAATRVASHLRNGDRVEVEGDMPPDPPFLAASVTKLGPDPSPSGAWKWIVGGAVVVLALIVGYYWYTARQVHYFRLELENGGRYLRAENCSNQIVLTSAPNSAEPDCELWREVPDINGTSRYQLKSTKLFLTVHSCLRGRTGASLAAKAPDGNEDQPCQRWRPVPFANGWSRLDLPAGKGYLDADHCSSDKLSLNPYPGSTYDNGSCQLWRRVP